MGGGGGKSQSEGGSKVAERVVARFEQETRPLRGGLVDMFTSALSGDVPGAGIPIVARAEEAQKRAMATGLRETGQTLAQKGLLGTPFGEQIIAQQRQAGQTAVGGVVPAFLQQMLQLATGYATGQASASAGGLGATRETQASSKQWQGAI